MSVRKQQVVLLGSTGSVGGSTLDVLARHPERYQVHALAANCRDDLMLAQCERHAPRIAVMSDADAAERLQQAIHERGLDTQVRQGPEALEAIAGDDETDVVVAAIVGAAGLLSTLAAAGAGKRLLLANKEALVMSGHLLMDAAREAGALIMPLDSEHNAIFQSLPDGAARALNGPASGEPAHVGASLNRHGIDKILLTASGGPFRTFTPEQLAVVTPQQAVKHPNWSMGPKISVDSATLMNKGLEIIEACHLFDVTVDRIEVVVHPQSVIHSMVSYLDGSVIAQLGRPDMRTPIAHALAWPERIDAGVAPLDFSEVAGLHFEKPDPERFPALRLAMEAMCAGGTAPTLLNAANEVAVAAFLAGDVSFLQLMEIVENTLITVKKSPADDLTTIIEADDEARQLAHTLVQRLQCRSHRATPRTRART